MNQFFNLKNKTSLLFLVLLGVLFVNYLAFYMADKSLSKSMAYLEIAQKNTISLHKSVFFARNITEGRRININNLNHEVKLINQHLELLKKGGVYLHKGEELELKPSKNKALSEFLRDWKEFRQDLYYISQNIVRVDSQQVYYLRVDDYLSQDQQNSLNTNLEISEDLTTSSASSDEFIDPLLFDQTIGQGELIFNDKTEQEDMLDYEKAGFILKNTAINTPTLEAKRRVTNIVKNAESLSLLSQSVASNDALAFNNKQKQIRVAVFLGLLMNLLLLVLAYWFVFRNTILPLKKIKKIITELSEGKINTQYTIKRNDELGDVFYTINQLAGSLGQISNFANQIGAEDFSMELEPRSKDDALVYALLDMKNNLKKNTDENLKRNWVNGGMSEFGRILRLSTDLEELCRTVISNLVHYLKINQGGIFIIQENDEQTRQELHLLASYAYDKVKYQQKTIQIGEGLIGQVILDKELLYLDKVPDGYTKISSGLGETTPQILVIIPLLLNSEVYGAIELASFRHFEDHELAFIQRLSENIASSVASLNTNLRTQELLQKTQNFAQKAKSEEMNLVQKMKKLGIAQMQMRNAQKDIEKREVDLHATIDHTDLLIITLDKEYNITVINRPYIAMLERLRGIKVELGMNLLETLSPAEHREWLPYYERAMSGETYTIIRNVKDYQNEDIYYQINFQTIYNKSQEITGFSIFTRNITSMNPIRWRSANKAAEAFE